VVTHLLFSGLLAGLFTGLNEYTCTQYVIPVVTLLLIIFSWTGAGGFLVRRRATGQTIISYLIIISLYYLYFPYGRNVGSNSLIQPWPDLLLVAVFISSVIYSAGNPAWKNGVKAIWPAVVVTMAVAATFTLVTTLMPISQHLEGPSPDFRGISRVFLAGTALAFSAWVVLYDGIETAARSGGGFDILDYRLQFTIVAAALSVAGTVRTYDTISEYRSGADALDKGELVQAAVHLETAASFNSDLRVPLLHQRIYEALTALYAKRLSKAPYDTRIMFKLAAAEFSLGWQREAAALVESVDLHGTKVAELEAYSGIVANLPDFTAAHLKLGQAFLSRGFPDKADAEYLRITRVVPHHAMALCGLAEALRREGRTAEAEKAMIDMAAGVEQEAWKGRFGRSVLTEEPSYADVELCQGIWEMDVGISGESAAGAWPHVIASVDGAKVTDYTISHPEKRTYKARFRIERPGIHRIQFAMDNDFAVFRDGKMVEDRNVHLFNATLRWAGH
jgi:hypothetical protein